MGHREDRRGHWGDPKRKPKVENMITTNVRHPPDCPCGGPECPAWQAKHPAVTLEFAGPGVTVANVQRITVAADVAAAILGSVMLGGYYWRRVALDPLAKLPSAR